MKNKTSGFYKYKYSNIFKRVTVLITIYIDVKFAKYFFWAFMIMAGKWRPFSSDVRVKYEPCVETVAATFFMEVHGSPGTKLTNYCKKRWSGLSPATPGFPEYKIVNLTLYITELRERLWFCNFVMYVHAIESHFHRRYIFQIAQSTWFSRECILQ